MSDNAVIEGGALIGIKSMMSQLAARHLTDRVDEIPTVEILEPILIRIVGVQVAIKLVGRRILNSIFIMSILGEC